MLEARVEPTAWCQSTAPLFSWPWFDTIHVHAQRAKELRGGGEEQQRLTGSEEHSVFSKSLTKESHGNHQL